MFLIRFLLSLIAIPFLILAYVVRIVFSIFTLLGYKIIVIIAGLLFLGGAFVVVVELIESTGELGSGIAMIIGSIVCYCIPYVMEFLLGLLDLAIDWLKDVICGRY